MVEAKKAKVIEEIKHDIDSIKPVLEFTVKNTLLILSILTPDEINSIEFLAKTLRNSLNDKLKDVKSRYKIKKIYFPELIVK